MVDVEVYACLSYHNTSKTCGQVSKNSMSKPIQKAIAAYYARVDPDDRTCTHRQALPFQESALKSSLWRRKKKWFFGGSVQTWAIQVLPSIQFGIPAGAGDGDASSALNTSAILGGKIRFTTTSYWMNFTLFGGVQQTAREALPEAEFPDPSLVLWGGGIEGFGGTVGVSYAKAYLRPNSLTSPTVDSTTFWMFTLDIASLALPLID